MAPAQSGYEVTVDLPPSVAYNLFFIDPNAYISGTATACYYQPVHRGGDYSPHSARNGNYKLQIEIYEAVYGFVPIVRLIDLCAAYQPTSVLGYRGTVSYAYAVPPTGITIPNPARFRIAYHSSFPWLDPAFSWTGVNLGLSDTCQIVRSPTNIVGHGDGGVWTAVGAPAFAITHPTLPTGGPLAGRNRVQLIS
jgi:hypothetical protein